MTDMSDTMDYMMALWQEGQESVLNAQRDFAENISAAMAQSFSPDAAQASGDDPQATDTDEIDPFAAWHGFIRSWAPTWSPMNEAYPQNPAASDFFTLFDTSAWMSKAPEQLRAALKNMADMPRFADMAMPHADAAEAMADMQDFQQASTQFFKVMSEAWQRSYTEYLQHYSVEDLKSGRTNDALQRWLDIANKELLSLQATATFMDAQKRFLKASLKLRKRQANQAERWANAYQLPTRTEIDDLTQSVYELRREVRTLKRQLAVATIKAGT